MIHTSNTRNGVTFFTPINDYVSSRSKKKTTQFEANVCGSLYSTFKLSFYPYAFYNKRLQTLFKDQLEWSKATCSFNSYFLSLIDVKFASEIKNINFLVLPMNTDVLALDTQYFPEFFAKKNITGILLGWDSSPRPLQF